MVRISSAILHHIGIKLSIVLALCLGLAWVGGGACAGERTIIESLDAVVDQKTGRVVAANAKNKAYDYSVERELLPPIDPSLEGQETPAWEVVVTAQDIQTGSLATPPPSQAGSTLIVIVTFVVLTSLLLFLRQFQPQLASAFANTRVAKLKPNIDLSHWVNRLGAAWPFAVREPHQQQSATPEPDHQIEAAAADLAKRLVDIEGIVAQLKDGSPLRDVLNQELRLIHYRISAATDAARAGQTTLERSAARFHGLVRELERVRRFADGAAASVIDPHDRVALPGTPSEAYALLGVNEDAPIATVKKLVDALRVTWHPDHARNESDRVLREERIKQINSAWDLINPGVRRADSPPMHEWT